MINKFIQTFNEIPLGLKIRYVLFLFGIVISAYLSVKSKKHRDIFILIMSFFLLVLILYTIIVLKVAGMF
jgi:hypothetical protein